MKNSNPLNTSAKAPESDQVSLKVGDKKLQKEKLSRVNARFGSLLPYMLVVFFLCVWIGTVRRNSQVAKDFAALLGKSKQTNEELGIASSRVEDLEGQVASSSTDARHYVQASMLVSTLMNEMPREHGELSGTPESPRTSVVQAMPGQARLVAVTIGNLLDQDDAPFLHNSLIGFDALQNELEGDFKSEGEARAAIERVVTRLQEVHRQLDVMAANPMDAPKHLRKVEKRLANATAVELANYEEALVNFGQLAKSNFDSGQWIGIDVSVLTPTEVFELAKQAELLCRRSRTCFILLSALVERSPRFEEFHKRFSISQDRAKNITSRLSEILKGNAPFADSARQLAAFSESIDRRSKSIESDTAVLVAQTH